MSAILQLRNLSRIYYSEGARTAALSEVNLDVARGEFLAVMGPSGCGKSTLLNIMGLLDRPSAGRVRFLGQDLTESPESEHSRVRGRHIGFIFQSYNLIEELTVAENIELALLYRGLGRGERRRRVASVLDRLGIAHRARHKPGQLSGGQQQRVALARAVVGEQSLILADEPTGNLDSVQGQEVMELLRGLNETGTTIVMATHSPVHADYAGRVIHLFDGGVLTENFRAPVRNGPT